MKIVLYMAQTINGKIAKKNYGEEFLTDASWNEFVKFAEETGCFVIGRKTYEIYKKKNSSKYTFDRIKAKRVILSRKPKLKLTKGYILARSPKDALNKLSRLGFRKMMVAGGGIINSSFMKAGLIDGMIINVEPYVLGEGIKVFSEDNFEVKLKLLSVKKLGLGIVQLRYVIVR